MQRRLAIVAYVRLISANRQGPSACNDPDRPPGKGFFNGRQSLSYSVLVLRLRSPQPEVRYPRQQAPPGQAPVVGDDNQILGCSVGGDRRVGSVVGQRLADFHSFMSQVEQQRGDPARDVVVDQPLHPPNPDSAGLLAQSTHGLDISWSQFWVLGKNPPLIPSGFQHPTNRRRRDTRSSDRQLA